MYKNIYKTIHKSVHKNICKSTEYTEEVHATAKKCTFGTPWNRSGMFREDSAHMCR